MSNAKSNRKYCKTFKGKLMMTYNNMNRRVRGYTLDNIQWITHSENSKKGSKSRWTCNEL